MPNLPSVRPARLDVQYASLLRERTLDDKGTELTDKHESCHVVVGEAVLSEGSS